MSAKLEQLLNYLDRAGVTELVFGVGRPVAFKTAEGYRPITAAVLTPAQIDGMLAGSPLDGVLESTTDRPFEVQVGRRRVTIEILRVGEHPVIRITRAAAPAPATATPTPAAAVTPAPTAPAPRPAAAAPAPASNPQRAPSTSALASFPRPAPTPSPLGGHAAPVARQPSPLAVEPAPLASQPSSLAVESLPLAVDSTPLAVEPSEPPAAHVNRPGDFVFDDKPIELEVEREEWPRPPPAGAAPMAATMRAPVAAPMAAPTSGPRDAPVRMKPATGRVAPIVAAAPAVPLTVEEPTMLSSDAPDSIIDERSDVSAFAAIARAAFQRGASDLHVMPGRPLHIRVAGELVPLEATGAVMSHEDCERMLMPLLGRRRRQRLAQLGYVDLAVVVQGAGRLRTNVSRVQGGLRGAFRLAIPAPATLEELGLPRDLAKVVQHHQGLVVVAGPSGHGKTTTLAALVDLVNESKPFHIITIEDPVEIEHPRKQALVSQREVGRHTKSFVAALKGSLREDPDVIVIGELRDRETVEIALTAAETGHLVIATMSTPSAAKTIDRLIDMFPPDEQSQARASIAGALRAIIAQRLVPALRGGVLPAVELVTGVLPLAVMIRENKLIQLPNLMQRGRAFGMIRFDESLLELVRTGKISEATVRQYAENQKELGQQLASVKATTTQRLVPEKR